MDNFIFCAVIMFLDCIKNKIPHKKGDYLSQLLKWLKNVWKPISLGDFITPFITFFKFWET